MTIDYNQPARIVDADTLKATLARLVHGDTVKATFYDKHYRTFDITGVISTASYDANLFVLASWFLNSPTEAKGNSNEILGKDKPSSFLKSLEILETTERALF